MAKKKITKTEESEKAEVKNVDSFNYQGTIKVSIMKGNKAYSTKIFKNSGRWPLFYFLNCCLTGDYATAENSRPKYLEIFSAGVEDEPIISDNREKLGDYAKADGRVNLVTYTYASEPSVEKQEGNIGSCKVTYKFLIPFTHLSIKNSDNTFKKVNLLCLYDSNNASSYGDASAFFFVRENETSKKLGSLINVENFNTKNNEYNLYIEWSLQIAN